MGSAVEELLEHGELGAGEALAGTLCGRVGWAAENGFVGIGGGGGAEAGRRFGAEEVSTDRSHEAQRKAVA